LGWAIGAAATTVVATASYLGLLPFAELMAPGGRMLGLFKDPNVYGAYLVGPAVWAAARLVTLERGRRLPWLITLLACGAGVLLSYSRGAWISMAVALLVFFVLRMVAYGSPRARVMTLLMVPVAAVLLTVALDRLASVDAVQNMLDQRLGMQGYDVDRFATQREALETAAELPLGLGPGQSEGYFTRATHNTYIHSLVETGYLGGLTFTLILIVSQLRASWMALDARDPKLQTAMAVVAGCMAAICVESMVIDSIHWRHLWILAAMAWTPGVRGRAKAALDKVAGP
jgi:O-antigen ligase